MSELSPAAQAVLGAYSGSPLIKDHLIHRYCLASALRAAADQLKYKLLDVEVVDCSQLRLLAEELEAQ